MLLVDHGKHCERSVPDLVIATTAENVGLIVLVVDKDFDLIAAAAGQLVSVQVAVISPLRGVLITTMSEKTAIPGFETR